MRASVLSVAAVVALTYGHAFGSDSALIGQINAADLIVLGETTDAGTIAAGQLSFGVNIAGTLKGSSPGASVTVHFTPASGPQSFAAGAAGRCGIFFLAQGTGGWSVIPRTQPPFILDDLYYPEGTGGSVAPPTSSVPTVDDILSAVINAVQSGTPSDRLVADLFRSVNATDSPVVAAAASQMSSAAQPALQVLSLGWRLSLGQDQALPQVLPWIATLKQSPLGGILVGAISGYGGTSASAMGGLGQIALQGGGTGFDFAASLALRSAHTTDALPYLMELLSSSDVRVRLNAVAGLSMALAGVPPLSSGSSPQAVFERAMNPAFRKPLNAEDQAHLVFASLGDAANEASLIAWWRSRAQQMIATGQ